MSVCGKQHSEIGESEPNTKALGRTEKYQPNTLQIWHNTDNKLQQCPPFSENLLSILSEVNTVKVAIYWPTSDLCVKINQFKINLKNVCGFTVNYDTARTEFEFLRTEFQKWHCCLKKHLQF